MNREHTVKTIRIGQGYIVDHRLLPSPRPARVVVLTTEPGRHVGVEFDREFPGCHDLDGRVAPGRGLWVHPGDLLTEQEYRDRAAARRANAQEVAALSFDPATGEVAG